MLIKSLRQKKRISQEQLADVTGLSLRTIQRAESGQRVGDSSLQSLAEFFEVNVETIVSSVSEGSEVMDNTESKSEKLLAHLAYHRAAQLIIFIVTFFVFVVHWLNYYASMNPGPDDDASLWTILLYVAYIAAGAAIFAYFFGRAQVSFYRSYYITSCCFLALGLAINYWIGANYEKESTLLVFPVFFTLMFLILCVIHVLQMAVSLKSESSVVVRLNNGLTEKATYLDSSNEADDGLITN